MDHIFLAVYIVFSFLQISPVKVDTMNISHNDLISENSRYYERVWKFHSGDNPQWADPEFNDSSWTVINNVQTYDFPNGTNWFRLHFNIDSSLYNKTVMLLFRSAGKQKIYLDGKYLTDISNIENPTIVTFSPKRNHLLAVKYTIDDVQFYKDAGFSPGFSISFNDIDTGIRRNWNNIHFYTNQQIFFTALTIAFGLLHLILFLFNRQFKENLVYSIFLFVFAASIFFDYQANLAFNTTQQIILIRVHRVLMSLSNIFALLSLYSILKQKIGKPFWAVLIYYIVSTVFVFEKPIDNFYLLQIGLIILFLECLRITFISSKQKLEGVGIITAGFLILFLFSFYDWLLDMHLIGMIGNIDNGYPFGAIGLFICMSIFLSKSFAKSNRRIIEQEKLNNEQEIERKYLEAENDRKSLELEDARKLQLSILPKNFPKISSLEISAEMRTAAEVGGDYYDYHITSDGILTLVIGDATGHGIKSGIMVTLIKSLFDAMAHTFFIPDFFNHCTKTIKKMNLGNLYMGMTVLKVRDYKITASAAGMPPFLVYRQGKDTIEEIVLKGMPLGAFTDFQYQQKIIKVNPGDMILLLTDGFIELFNQKKEMLGFNSVKNIFLESARNNSAVILSELFAAADKWLNGCKQTDDITFLLLKIK